MPLNKDLSLFARQLAAWAEQIIENGRTPFRRVDLFHSLLTTEGLCNPPLIFWINRQSLIAGGLLFLPSAQQKDYQLEAAAAAALGLQHFITWEVGQVNIRLADDLATPVLKNFPLSATEDPSVFHHRLYELIDELKLLSVTGRIEPGKEPCHYLLNLILETENLARAGFVESCRLHRSTASLTLSAEEEAQDWNRLSLLRLLCLLNWHPFPTEIHAEGLHKILEELVPALPKPLATALGQLTPAPGQVLPSESTIAFHHLLLRLQQVGWKAQSTRGQEALKQLILHWHGQPSNTDSAAVQRLMLHSQELAPRCAREVSHLAAQLAANSIWRFLHEASQPIQLQGDAFDFSLPFAETILHANLFDNLRPDQRQRRKLTGHLRSSWPNRHLSIPGDLPFWVIEAIHLLGLTRAEARTELHLPSSWLKLLRGTPLIEILFDSFTLEEVDCCDNRRHLLSLWRTRSEKPTVCHFPGAIERKTELGRSPKTASERLLYALELPDPLYSLFDEQILVPLQSGSPEAAAPEALLLYSKSRLADRLWSLASELERPSEITTLITSGAACGWLVPEASYLQDLGYSQGQNIDIALNNLLNLPTELDFDKSPPKKGFSQTKTLSRSLTEELLHQLQVTGIPQFPNTYLYRQDTGPLQKYSFTPSLTLTHEMLGEYELLDAGGKILKIVGEETKEALMLASLLGRRQIELPRDRHQTTKMLDSYRQDLQALLEKIDTLCLKHADEPQAANRLRKKLWRQLDLPPLGWLSG